MTNDKEDDTDRDVVMVASKARSKAITAARHEQLVKAAMDLFLEQGFHKTTTRQIAAAAGWPTGTFYHYISQKEDVLFLLNQYLMSRRLRALRSVSHLGTATETLTEVMLAYFTFVRTFSREISFLYRESHALLPEHVPALRALFFEHNTIFKQIIERGIASGEFSPVDPDIYAHNIFILGDMWGLQYSLLRESGVDFDTFVRTQTEMVLRGLAPRVPAHDAVTIPSLDKSCPEMHHG